MKRPTVLQHKCKPPRIQINSFGGRFEDGVKWRCNFGKCRQTWVIKNAKWERL